MLKDKCRPQPNPNLLITKFAAPVNRTAIVQRNRLTSQIRLGMRLKLTLICAPAGYGKTTLLSEWLAIMNQMSLPVAWLSLDADDNLSLRFWTYFAQALNLAVPELQYDPSSLIGDSPDAPNREALIPLINRLSVVPGHVYLVLDDYHLIDNERIHTDLAYFIHNMPFNLHLVIASRAIPSLPISELRAKNQLLEIRSEEMLFQFNETTVFFRDIMKLELDDHEVLLLLKMTEGWVTGLQLAALSLLSNPNHNALLTNFHNSHRHTLEYLTDIVLEQQTHDIQDFLVKTSILKEFSAALCDHLLSINHSQEILDYLERANLFTFSLDEYGGWYRYHAMFAEMLNNCLNQLGDDIIQDLHHRACAWFRQNGRPDLAISHANAVADYALMADIIETCAHPTATQFQMAGLVEWIGRLPEELVQTRPKLSIFQTLAKINLGRLNEIEDLIHQTEKALHYAEESGSGRGELEQLQQQVAALRTVFGYYQQDYQDGIAPAIRALADSSWKGTYFFGWLAYYLGCVYFSQGDNIASMDVLDQACQNAIRIQYHQGYIFSLCQIARQYKLMGQLKPAQEVYQKALSYARDTGLGIELFILPQAGLGDIYREQNDNNPAQKMMANVARFLEQVNIYSLDWNYSVIVCAQLAKYFFGIGEYQQAFDYYQKSYQGSQNIQLFSHLSSDLMDVQVRLWIHQGDMDSAQCWVEQTSKGARKNLSLPEQIAKARIRLALDRPKIALDLLEEIELQARTSKMNGYLIECLILEAMALKALRENHKAVEKLLQAVQLAAPQGYVRIFIDEGKPMRDLLEAIRVFGTAKFHLERDFPGKEYIEKLFQIADAPPLAVKRKTPEIDNLETIVVTPEFESLTDREIELLSLLVDGRTSSEIAQSLFISKNTVKAHIRNIYQKLGVNNRRGAVEWAIEFNLLGNEKVNPKI